MKDSPWKMQGLIKIWLKTPLYMETYKRSSSIMTILFWILVFIFLYVLSFISRFWKTFFLLFFFFSSVCFSFIVFVNAKAITWFMKIGKHTHAHLEICFHFILLKILFFSSILFSLYFLEWSSPDANSLLKLSFFFFSLHSAFWLLDYLSFSFCLIYIF